jgi:hypothetical protein
VTSPGRQVESGLALVVLCLIIGVELIGDPISGRTR